MRETISRSCRTPAAKRDRGARYNIRFAMTRKTAHAALRSFLLTALTLSTLHASAQNASTSKPADAPRVYRWSESCDGCKLLDVQGTKIKVQNAGDLELGVSIREQGNFLRAFVQLLNRGNQPVHLDPQRAVLEFAAPKPKTFAAIDPLKA